MTADLTTVVLAALVTIACACAVEAPWLRRREGGADLMVDGRPFIMLAGELHNSSGANEGYIRRVWQRLEPLHLNTVLSPVSWETVEPEEGQFDFHLVDVMLEEARARNHRLVLLWFGSWKNAVSGYAPGWVLEDTRRFPRAIGAQGGNVKDVLSTLSAANRDADACAFARLMAHLRANDPQHTVIMVQVENEVGIMPEARDRSPEADAVWSGPTPEALTAYLLEHEAELHPELLHRWSEAGKRRSGSWAEVFGNRPEGEEVFSAWYYARYMEAVAAAGYAEKAIPLYANAWLTGGGSLGGYPSGGPVSHMHDVWRAAAPTLCLLAPDIYGSFVETAREYARGGNPLFIPEAWRETESAGRAYWVLGQLGALGFSPFGIESMEPDHPLVTAYGLLQPLIPAIARAAADGRIIGIHPTANQDAPYTLPVGDCNLQVTYQQGLPAGHPPVGGLVMQTGHREYILAGYGFGVRFDGRGEDAGRTHILRVEIGQYDGDGQWQTEVRLNGDETSHQGEARIPPFLFNEFLGLDRQMVLRVTLYLRR